MIELKYVRKPEDQKVIKTALLTRYMTQCANKRHCGREDGFSL